MVNAEEMKKEELRSTSYKAENFIYELVKIKGKVLDLEDKPKHFHRLDMNNGGIGITFPCTLYKYPCDENKEAIQYFYDAGDFIFRIDKNGTNPKVYTKEQIDIVRTLLNNDIITFGDKPRQQEDIQILEKAFSKDMFWINGGNMTRTPVIERIIAPVYSRMEKCLDAKLHPDKWDVGFTPVYGAMGFGQELTKYHNASANPVAAENPEDLPDSSKIKRFVFMRKEDLEAKDHPLIDGKLKSKDRVVMLDDILGTGGTMNGLYDSLKAANSDRKIIGYFTILDLLRRNDGKFAKEMLAEQGIIGCSAIDLEAVVDVFYVRKNNLFGIKEGERNKYNEKIIEWVKNQFETYYKVSKTNCKKRIN